jgi:hypothetical protein
MSHDHWHGGDLLNVQARLAGIMLNEQPNYEMVGPSK